MEALDHQLNRYSPLVYTYFSDPAHVQDFDFGMTSSKSNFQTQPRRGGGARFPNQLWEVVDQPQKYPEQFFTYMLDRGHTQYSSAFICVHA